MDIAFLLDAFLFDGVTRFSFYLLKNMISLEKDLKSPLIFVLFLKRKTK